MGGIWGRLVWWRQGSLKAIVASWIPDFAVSPCNSIQAIFSPFCQRYSLLAAAQSAAGVSVPNLTYTAALCNNAAALAHPK